MAQPSIVALPGPGYSTLARNAVATLLGRFCAIGLAVLLSTVLFRTLTPERYGLWSLFVLLTGYSMMFDFGLSAAVEQRVARLAAARDAAGIRHTLNAALAVVVIAVLALQLIALGAWSAARVAGRSGDLASTLIVLPACIGMTAGSLVVGAGLTGLQRMTIFHLWRSLGIAGSTTTTLILATSGVTRLDVLLVAYAIGGPLAAAAQWVSIRSLVPGLRFAPAWDRSVVNQLFHFGGTLQAATLAPVVADYLFRVMAGARFGVAYAGIYDLGARAGMVLRSLAGSLFATLVPFGVHTLARGNAEASRLHRLAVKYTALFMIPASALLFKYAGPLTRAWLGPDPMVLYVQQTFQVLLVAHAVASLAVPAAMLGRSAARPGPEAVVTTAAAALGLGASLVISSFVPAVAVFAVAAALGGIAIGIWISRRLGLDIPSARDLAAIVALSIAAYVTAVAVDWLMAAAGFGRRSPIAVVTAMLGAGSLVALLSWLARIVDERERASLRAAFGVRGAPLSRTPSAVRAGGPVDVIQSGGR